jgi:hypothetical protein
MNTLGMEYIKNIDKYFSYFESIKQPLKFYPFDFIASKQSISKDVYKQYLKISYDEPDWLIKIDMPQSYLNKYNNGNFIYLPKILAYIIIIYYVKLLCYGNDKYRMNSNADEWFYDRIIFYHKDYDDKKFQYVSMKPGVISLTKPVLD